MNWRLKLLSVLILGIFAAFVYYYYKYFVSPKPSGIVLFIVPGLNLDNLAQVNDNSLNMLSRSTRFAVINNDDLAPFRTHTNSIFSYLATGYKTRPDRIGVSSDGRVQDNLLYMAQRAGRSVGLVGTGSITAVELAAFYAHSKNPDNNVNLLQQLFDNTKINVILGGGGNDFSVVKKTANRDLFHEAELNGYKIVRTNDELQDLPVWRAPWQSNRTLGVFAPQNLPFYDPLEDESGHNPYPSLTDMTRRAIQFLDTNLNRYFLVVHDGLVADAIRNNNPQQVTNEIRQLDNALAEARNQTGKDAVIVIYSPYNVAPSGSEPADNSFGWLVIYGDNDDPIKGFATGKDFFRYLRKQL
jgi:alkaline phosphatase